MAEHRHSTVSVQSKRRKRIEKQRSCNRFLPLILWTIVFLLFVVARRMRAKIRLYKDTLKSRRTSVVTLPFWESHPDTSTNNSNPIRDICLFYDRPPRTGSSTISLALHQCWVDTLHAKTRLDIPASLMEQLRNDSINGIDHFLTLRAPVVAHHAWHCHVYDHHIAHIKKSCRQLFYVSSTRDKKSRILSVIKHILSGNNRLANGTISLERLRLEKDFIMSEILKKNQTTESIYPFKGTLRLSPDYIVRTEHLQTDLAQLLSHFGCSTNYTSMNVHHMSEASEADSTYDDTISQEIQNTLDAVFVNEMDLFHQRLTNLAEVKNELGLEKASHLAKQIVALNHDHHID